MRHVPESNWAISYYLGEGIGNLTVGGETNSEPSRTPLSVVKLISGLIPSRANHQLCYPGLCFLRESKPAYEPSSCPLGYRPPFRCSL